MFFINLVADYSKDVYRLDKDDIFNIIYVWLALT
jgi:hypothetical protein